jgi:hypothetical protein
MRRATAVLAALASLLGATAASAAPEALPYTKMTPRNGARIPRLGNLGHITFRVTTPVTYLDSVWVEVSTRKTLGKDGTLADKYQVDYIDLFPSGAHPRRYSGPSDGDWTTMRDTYYWQVYAAGYDPATGQHHDFRGPIRTLHIVKRCHYVKRHHHRRKVCN